jgi:uncharacterized protein (TIGR02271 family)
MPDDKNIDLPQNKQSAVPGEQVIIPVVHEQVKIDKKVIETGKVHISKVVYEDVERYNIPYIEENVSVERVPKNELLETIPPPVRYEDDVMIIPVLKEVAVVEKRIMLVEELRVTKTKTEKSQAHELSLRKEQVQVKRSGQDHSPS